MLQTLTELLLLPRRQTAEAGIVLQSTFLLRRRHVLVAPQPVAGVALWLRVCRGRTRDLPLRSRGGSLRLRVIRGGSGMPLLHGLEGSTLSQRGQGNEHNQRQPDARQPSLPVISPRHCLRPPSKRPPSALRVTFAR